MSTWVLVTFLGLTTLVAGAVVWRRLISPPAVAFSDLVDISDPQGHYALRVVGDPVPSNHPALVDQAELRLGLFVITPQRTHFDRLAVRVFFGPHEVGGLSRADARAYRRMYGTRPSRCRGLLGLEDNTYSVWLDASIGSGVAAASAVLHSPALAQVFPIPVDQDPDQIRSLGDFMRNRPACILNAQVGMSGDQAVVRASGSVVGHLPAQLAMLFAQIHGQSSVGTQVYIRPSADGPQVRLLANENLRPLLDRPSERRPK